MTIIATAPFYHSGTLVAAGPTQLNYSADIEGDLVRRGVASYVGANPQTGSGGAASWNASGDKLVTPTGGEIDVVHAKTVNGQTVLVGAGGVPFDKFPYPVNPNGLDWLTDTLHGFDIYERGFVKRPTLFFDPSATSSMNRGTFAHPYNTQAALHAVVKGDMRGQVLGYKRGTTFIPTNLEMTVYGTSSDPFTICPYGDAEALPIISAHAVPTWTLVDAGSNIWSYAIGATQHDAWQSGVRITNKTWSTSAVNTLTTAGTATYNSNTLYIRPYDGENPNLGQVFVSTSDYTMLLKYSDVAATGHIHVAGLDLRYARNTVLPISAATGASSITSVSGISIVGCKIGHAGYDAAGLTLASDAISVYGLSDAVRAKDVYIAGNECYDALNNAIEVAAMDGSTDGSPVIIEHNYGHDCGGNLAELWSSNNDVTVRYNYGHTFSTFGRLYTSFSGGGIWFTNYYNSAPGTWNTNDATNLKNANNKALFNLFEDCGSVCADVRGGTGHVVAHNTWIIDHDALFGATASKSHLPAGLYTNGTAATGYCNWSNNILYYKPSTLVPEGYLNPSFVSIAAGLGATNSVPTGNNNVYFVGTGYAAANWKHGANSRNKLLDGTNASWKYDLSVAGIALDQNSLAAKDGTTYGNLGGTLTTALVGMDFATWTPLAANIAGATSLTGIGTRYKDGRPYVAASCNAGALLGT